VRLIRYALPSPEQALGLPVVGKHVLVCATVGGKPCMRAYTSDELAGHFDLFGKELEI
jgi:nitrate reductase (NAD(P)H)